MRTSGGAGQRFPGAVLYRSREVFTFAGRARRAANPGAQTKRESRDFLRLALRVEAWTNVPPGSQTVVLALFFGFVWSWDRRPERRLAGVGGAALQHLDLEQCQPGRARVEGLRRGP
jgi:hypothetical protein